MTDTDRPIPSTDLGGGSAEIGDDHEESGDPVVQEIVGLAIDDLVLDTDWSNRSEQLERWRQGHLLARMPVTWLAPPGTDPITGEDQQAAELAPLFDPTGIPVVICTQTCDLGATPPGDRHPFIQVAPLVRGDQLRQARLRLAREGKAPDLVRVQPPRASHDNSVDIDSEWYADIRLQMPVSKACLLGLDPIEGFATDDEYQGFAERLAHKARRPALHAALSEDVPQLLTRFVRDNGVSKQCFAKVEQVRLLVLEGNRLNPSRATFYVLTDGIDLTEDEREVWSRFQSKASSLLKDRGIQVAPLIHADVNQLSAAKYRISTPITCEVLSALRFL